MTMPPQGNDDARVRETLRALSGEYPGLPSDVAQRLDQALDDLPEQTAPETAPVIPPPVKIPWWRRRFALHSALASVVVALIAGALLVTQPFGGSNDGGQTALDSAAGRNKTADESELGPEGKQAPGNSKPADDYTLTYSGAEYSAADLEEARGLTETGDASDVDSKLKPLVDDTEARQECLSSVMASFEGDPSSVDFGFYEETPAMVTVMESAQLGSVVAVGPRCGDQRADILGATTF